jgi:hypothetical protein
MLMVLIVAQVRLGLMTASSMVVLMNHGTSKWIASGI